MKYLIFVGMISAALFCSAQASAQGAYTYSSGYNYGYAPSYYYGTPPGYGGQPYYGGYPQPASPQYPDYSGYNRPAADLPPQVDISELAEWQKNPDYFAFIRQHTKDSYGSNPSVEIWLERRIGRIGDYWFEALGGMRSHPTPTGTFTVKSKYEDFYSRKYKAEMPLSVFFTEQCALHIGSLRVRSHGCIHLGSGPAQRVFSASRIGNTRVKVHS